MTYDKLKLPTAIIATLLPLSGAIAENYDGQDLTGRVIRVDSAAMTAPDWSFVGTNLTNAMITSQNASTVTITGVDFSGANFTGTTFSNVELGIGNNFSGSNLSYEQYHSFNNPTDINLSNMNLNGWNIGRGTVNTSQHHYTESYSNLNIANSTINNATLYYNRSLSSSIFENALTSTKSWQDKDLSGLRIYGSGTISNYDFTGFNLQNTSFYRAAMDPSYYAFTCNGFNFTSADLRGYSVSYQQLSSTFTTNMSNATHKNTIQARGNVYNLGLDRSGDLLHVREYRNKDGVAENLAAYLNSSYSGTYNVAGGAKILIEMGRLDLRASSGTFFNFIGSDSEKAMLEFRYDTAEYKDFVDQGIAMGIGVNGSSRLSFLSDYEIAVELTGAVDVGDNFLLIDGETTGAITVAGAFTKGENITVKLNGNELNDDDWDIVFSNGDLSITMLTAVPEPAIYAALAGALSLALAAARRRKA